MFFCKDISGEVQKVLSAKDVIQGTSNLLKTGIPPYLRLVLFLSPPALRLTPHEFPLVWFRLCQVRLCEEW